MPISDQPGQEEQLYQEFLVWKAGMGLGGGGFANPWATPGDMGTKQAAGGEAGGGSESIARGSKQAGGGLGSDLVEQFNRWAASMNQPALTTGPRPRRTLDSFTDVPVDLNSSIGQVNRRFVDPAGGGIPLIGSGATAALGPTQELLGAAAGAAPAAFQTGYTMPFTGTPISYGNALGLAGTAAGLVGAPPEVQMPLSGLGSIVSGAGSGAAAAQAAGFAAIGEPAAGGSSLGAGLGSGFAGGIAGGAAAGFGAAIAAASFLRSLESAQRLQHQAQDVQKLLGIYGQEYNTAPQSYADLAGNLERGIYTYSRARSKEGDYNLGSLAQRNQAIYDYLQGAGQSPFGAVQRGLAWTGITPETAYYPGRSYENYLGAYGGLNLPGGLPAPSPSDRLLPGGYGYYSPSGALVPQVQILPGGYLSSAVPPSQNRTPLPGGYGAA